MKRLFVLAVSCGICMAANAQHWQLVWSDEFNYTGLPDKSKWGYEEGFVRNQEPQYYTVDRPENARVENGCLVIEARKEQYPNAAYKPGSTQPGSTQPGSTQPASTQPAFAEYTSASLVTREKESWKYGRIEVRAKVPGGLGSWPAIWLLGADRDDVKWPMCGEVDIMEFLGKDPSRIYGTVHYADGSGKYAHKGGIESSVNPADGFHIYALQWYPDRLEFYYDSVKYFVFDISKADTYDHMFKKNFYLLLNLALGHPGSWAGPFADSELPMRYYVDYVRVYKEVDAARSIAAASADVPDAAAPASADSTLRLMKKVGDWQLNEWKANGIRYPRYDWVNAVGYTGLFALGQASGDPRYYTALRSVGDSLDWNTGPKKGMADDYCIAQTYDQLYGVYKEPRMIAAFRTQADSICALPHTEGLEWKHGIQYREWAWCDALFMGPPALAYLSTITGDPKYLDKADSLWWKTTDYLFDKKEDLYYRDARYFDQHEANGAKMFWSRGNGWVMGGLVRMLSNMPDDYGDRKRFVRLLESMAKRVASLQQPDGTWHTSLLDPGSYPNEETSGTGLYCYALAWGINHGILSRKHYLPVVEKAWQALVSAVHADGKLGYVQKIGDKPGAADENSTEAYGPGAFLLAGVEMMKLEAK